MRPSTRSSTYALRLAAQREMPAEPLDSSDDELPQPMKLSALTEALLSNQPPYDDSPARRVVRVSATRSPISTPGPVRTVRIPITSSGKRAVSSGSSSARSREPEEPESTVARTQSAINQGSVSRYAVGRTRYDEGYQSSMRIKRVGKVSGSFLSGPARRGRRRQSEETEAGENAPQEEIDARDAGSPRAVSPRASQPSRAVESPGFRLAAPPPKLPSSHDQENVPLKSKGKPQPHSPERRALAPRSHNANTPLRPAPPPPKMSVLETATATGGAATTHKKRNNVRVNGKIFTRLDVIGRGGSSRVYRVMAENHKIYALKRVSLEDADESTICGFKGEIDLLKSLKDVDRVVRLIDYENNEERKTLSVLMEMGELDFYKLITLRYNAEDAKFDVSFTRHYWREMLECLAAVHAHDIVHSDLKPANFVMVQGRLKLIDFGIANAIQTDETVNVHRDTHVGTPNYMSPESLLDTNQHTDSRGRIIHNQPKLVKVGKPSDIWSLGCILYQLVYGRPPFAHIQNQMSRCQAIISANHIIDFPTKGLGGAWVPKGLLATMKKCLERDLQLRPTAEQLLSDRDPFLHPVEYGEGVVPLTEELLGRILQNVAPKCRDRTPTDAELLSLWPAGYMASIKRNMQEGRL